MRGYLHPHDIVRKDQTASAFQPPEYVIIYIYTYNIYIYIIYNMYINIYIYFFLNNIVVRGQMIRLSQDHRRELLRFLLLQGFPAVSLHCLAVSLQCLEGRGRRATSRL